MTATQRKPPQKRTPPRSNERLLSITEAAARIGVSRTQIRRYMTDGHIEYGVLPSGRTMPTERSVQRFIGLALEGRL